MNNRPGPPKGVEWVRITTGRRIAYGVGATALLSVFLIVSWVDWQARKFGMLDVAIVGGTLAGGILAAFAAITGKEQRKIPKK